VAAAAFGDHQWISDRDSLFAGRYLRLARDHAGQQNTGNGAQLKCCGHCLTKTKLNQTNNEVDETDLVEKPTAGYGAAK
jgi:hypothetical protein